MRLHHIVVTIGVEQMEFYIVLLTQKAKVESWQRFLDSDSDNEYWWGFRYKVVREVFNDGLFIADSNYTTFLNELKAVFFHYKHGFSLRYRIKTK
jgi:hypothetical protein